MYEPGPLNILARLLKARGPPSITGLKGVLELLGDYSGFVSLVTEFLPEHQEEILGQPDAGARECRPDSIRHPAMPSPANCAGRGPVHQ